MSLKDFQIISKLGEGAYSIVYRVKRLIDNQQYAMKKVKMNNLSEKEKENALNEVRILASINHPSVISYKEAFIQKGTNYLCIIMEFADGGDLLGKIKEHQKMNTKFEESQIWSIFIQVLEGLKILHDMKILHRDIKSANVFLCNNGQAKLGDLNVSKMVKSMCQTQTGTPYYASPEIWKDQPYDKKSDIWSLGCVLYEAISLKPPFRANDMEGLYKKIVRGFYPHIPPDYSNDLSIILKMMLQVAPHLRSSTDKLIEFPLIQKHYIDLPQGYFGSKQKKAVDLMKTIKIEKIQGTDELNKKVALPRPRYYNSIDEYSFEERNSKQNHRNDSFLPKIGSRTIDYEDARQSIEVEWNRKNQIVRKITEPLKSENPRKHVSMFENKRQRNVSQLESCQTKGKRVSRMHEGRLRQISPKILEKILKNEREKQKIRSIIGNN